MRQDNYDILEGIGTACCDAYFAELICWGIDEDVAKEFCNKLSIPSAARLTKALMADLEGRAREKPVILESEGRFGHLTTLDQIKMEALRQQKSFCFDRNSRPLGGMHKRARLRLLADTIRNMTTLMQYSHGQKTGGQETFCRLLERGYIIFSEFWTYQQPLKLHEKK